MYIEIKFGTFDNIWQMNNIGMCCLDFVGVNIGQIEFLEHGFKNLQVWRINYSVWKLIPG